MVTCCLHAMPFHPYVLKTRGVSTHELAFHRTANPPTCALDSTFENTAQICHRPGAGHTAAHSVGVCVCGAAAQRAEGCPAVAFRRPLFRVATGEGHRA